MIHSPITNKFVDGSIYTGRGEITIFTNTLLNILPVQKAYQGTNKTKKPDFNNLTFKQPLTKDTVAFSSCKNNNFISFRGVLNTGNDIESVKSDFTQSLKDLILKKNVDRTSIQVLFDRLLPDCNIVVKDIKEHHIPKLALSESIISVLKNVYCHDKPQSIVYINFDVIKKIDSTDKAVSELTRNLNSIKEINVINSRIDNFASKLADTIKSGQKLEFKPVAKLIINTLKESKPANYKDTKPPLVLKVRDKAKLTDKELDEIQSLRESRGQCLAKQHKDGRLLEKVTITFDEPNQFILLDTIVHEITHGLQHMTDELGIYAGDNKLNPKQFSCDVLKNWLVMQNQLWAEYKNAVKTVIGDTEELTNKQKKVIFDTVQENFGNILFNNMSVFSADDTVKMLQFFKILAEGEVQAYQKGINTYKHFETTNNVTTTYDLIPELYQLFTDYLDDNIHYMSSSMDSMMLGLNLEN